MKSLKKSKVAEIYYYEPQSAEVNVQSPQSESTPRRLTLPISVLQIRCVFPKKCVKVIYHEFSAKFSEVLI